MGLKIYAALRLQRPRHRRPDRRDGEIALQEPEYAVGRKQRSYAVDPPLRFRGLQQSTRRAVCQCP